MKLSEILAFLIPNFSDPVQLVFFVLIFGLAIFSIVWAKIKATPDTWEKTWEDGEPNNTSNNLDSEHGSIHDLSDAAASTAEKLVEILPGVLLVIGLLGTFIGLGVALNKASGILNGAGSVGGDIGQMDSAMQNLMSMLQGLGTKFRASTWGITGFLMMKILSSYFAFEDKRLRWCIKRVKGQFDIHRKDEADKRQTENQMLVAAIKEMGTVLCQTFDRNITSHTDAMLQSYSDFSNINKNGLQEIKTVFEEGFKETKEGNNIINHSIYAICDSINQQANLNAQTICRAYSGAFSENQKGLQDIRAAIFAFSGENKTGLSEVKKVLGDSIRENKENLEAMKSSVTTMSESTQKLSSAAGELQSVVKKLDSGISESLSRIKNDLGSSIKEMSESIGTATENIGTVVVNLDKGISESLDRMKNDLGNSTKEMSESIGTTMNGVKDLLQESDKRQVKMVASITTATETLGSSADVMQTNLSKIGNEINSGLKAVSTGNQKVESMMTGFKQVSETMEKVADVTKETASVTLASSQKNASSMEKIADAISKFQIPSFFGGKRQKNQNTRAE